jgi:hypothetical protein
VVTLAVVFLCAPAARAQPTAEELAAVFDSLYKVYDMAGGIERHRAELHQLPQVSSATEMLQVLYGSADLQAMDKFQLDGWGNPLQVESAPGKGYVVAAAGSDRRFAPESWSKTEETHSAADDIVLRDGVMVRSPLAWAMAAAAQRSGLAAGSSREIERGRHGRTLATLRNTSGILMSYRTDHGRLPPARTPEELVRALGRDMDDVTDGWERPFHVAIDPAADRVTIVSAGSDGRLDPKCWSDPKRACDDIAMRDFVIVRGADLPPRSGGDDRLAQSMAAALAAKGRFEAQAATPPAPQAQSGSILTFIEQGGKNLAIRNGRVAVGRAPFTLVLRFPAKAEVQAHLATMPPSLEAMLLSKQGTADLFPPGGALAEKDRNEDRTLFLSPSDDATYHSWYYHDARDQHGFEGVTVEGSMVVGRRTVAAVFEEPYRVTMEEYLGSTLYLTLRLVERSSRAELGRDVVTIELPERAP